ncbi:hypothetical protein BDZ97DRAFT_1913460 [Flammula alnicola]|nr:hypothetical protein BDZ97DRAFT_1913460 [Flammula alnicola]
MAVTSMDMGTPDIAAEFVNTFYHDSGDEMYTDEEEDHIFDLYSTSRPLTPLDFDKDEAPDDEAVDGSDHESESDSVSFQKKARHSTSTIKNVSRENPSNAAHSKETCASEVADELIAQPFSQDPQNISPKKAH